MNKLYRISAEQVANLRNNMIISEALNETESATPADSGVSSDYSQEAVTNINRMPNDPQPSQDDVSDSNIYGDITKGIYNYAQTYNMPSKMASEIEHANDKISVPMAKEFIEKLLYGIYKMANDPAQNTAFERFMMSIGVTIKANLLTKDNEEIQ